jgi:energy-coupling factor transport system permease protein
VSDVAAQKEKLIRKVNMLALLLIMVCACAVSYLAGHIWFQIAFTCLLFVLTAVMGFAKAGFKFLLFYSICHTWFAINVKYGIRFPSPMVFSLLIESTPIFMSVYLLVQAPSGKLTAGLRELPLPSKMILTVIVIMRFMPTVILEFSDVKDAMRTRGFLRSPAQILLHPLATLEYAIVPMVFRSLKIADELAASCIVRGIESPYKKHGYYVNRIHSGDALLMMGMLMVTALFIVL